MAGLGYNGRGVGMATAMGKVLAAWAAGCPDDDLDFPITAAREMPLHSLRGLGVRATVAASRLMDGFGV
jgi:glycine/D-amino acid oxidase-like deaminating enzyme